jgi:phosphatidylcholine synthase
MPKLKLKAREPKRSQAAPRPSGPRPVMPLRRFLGWCVHAYTGLGLILAAMIAVLLFRGGPDAIRTAMVLMFVATLVDATDGTFARMVRIKEAVPSFDGRRLDDLIDFQTYTCLPLFLIWRANLLPPGQEGWLLFALVASAYGFCQVNIKTDDGYFLGFPSLWNVVAMYLYVLPVGSWTALGVVILLAVMTFVPSKHLYPSQPGRLNVIATVLGAIWGIMVAWLVAILPAGVDPRQDSSVTRLAVATLFYPAFYMAASWMITLKHWMRRQPGA